MKKKLHVVYIITKLELGGAQKVCLKLLRGLHDHGISSSLISGKQGMLAEDISSSEVVLLDSFKREVGFASLVSEIKTFFTLIKHLKEIRKKYDTVLVHTHSTKAGLIGRWAAWCAGINIRIHTIHGFAFHRHQPKLIAFIIYVLELFTSAITTHFVCVSSHDVKIGVTYFPRFIYKHSIIRAAVDWHTFYQPTQVPRSFPHDAPFIFGTVACFKKQKNLFDQLHAFELAYKTNNNIRLEIIGDGVLRPAIEQWIDEHQLSSVITLHGWQKDVVPFMSRWHCFVLSSLWEGLPCAVVEARLLKLPVLSYNTGGIHDVISSGENGLLYPQKDVRGLAKGMIELTQRPELHTTLQSHQDNLTDFNDMYMVRQHISLYEALSELGS